MLPVTPDHQAATAGARPLPDRQRYAPAAAATSAGAAMAKAGIEEAPAVLVTTHDDDVNIYLTLLLPIVAYVFLRLARRGVEKDIALVRSMDRLR